MPSLRTPHDADRASLARLPKKDLLQRARTRRIEGRSEMTKAQLIEALLDRDDQPSSRRTASNHDVTTAGQGAHPAASRVEAFTRLAEARARGEMVFLPRQLSGAERRTHVRQTIREDHQTRIADHNEEARAKFDKLAGSTYSFFRGTCLLFYRDLAGEDAWMPTVLTLGDVHPENFGVMPSVDDVPIFGVDDFDEAYYAPFTWDLKRGAVGFILAAEEIGGHGPKRQAKIVEAFVHGYVDGVRQYAREQDERTSQIRLDNAPPLIAGLIEDAMEDRSAWLARKYHDEYRQGFRADDEHVPVSSRREEFQAALDAYVRSNDIDVPQDRTPGMRVKDVCMRLGQGTASLGLPRYYLMIEGPLADGSDDVLLEFKQARRSALDGLVPPSPYVVDGYAERITHAQGVHLVDGDRFYGAARLDGMSFMVRERAPYRDSIDLADLSKSEWCDYADICGRTLAQSHALSDESGLIDHDAEPEILAAIGPVPLFVDDVLRFAQEAADRVRTDHAHFRADHALEAFTAIDHVYR
ncbi:DUF2252 family protein [Nocardioides sp. CFH 31398]|uniref:DUF2252 family protein n=1 Tax=Nocardioides sp. CFH 31398 TaxID=2919579 RepID=UPI001F054C4D|nr:DUF2252 family protein [Nocardioides sp. CFH 31398]MCH1868092.1 DUF2252 family protein [Nocardioides sp. CFH 31398]